MKGTVTRVVGMLLVLVAVAGLAGPAAAAPPSAHPAASTATVDAAEVGRPETPADIWGKLCAAGLLSPAAGAVGCGKLAADGKDTDPGSEAAKELADSVLSDLAKAAAEWTGDLIEKGLTWWLTTESVSVEDSGVMEQEKPGDPTSSLSLHAITLGIGTFFTILMAMFAGIKTAIQRKGQPLVQLAQGLLINVLVVTAGVGVIDSLLVASDKLTEAILKVGFDGSAPEQIAAMLLPHVANPAGLLIMTAVVLGVGLLQVILLFLRQAAVPIQALFLPIVGAGQLSEGSARQWLPRLTTVILTVITYKPCAAFLMAVGLVEIDNADKTIDWIRGVTTLVLSIIALPFLMVVFAPVGVAVGNASAGGGLASGLQAVQAAAALRGGGSADIDRRDGGRGEGGGTSPAEQASHMDRHGPAAGGPQSGSGGTAGSRTADAGSVPAQKGTADTPGTGAAAAGESAAGAGGTSSGAAAGSGAAGAGGGPVTVAVVAAEAAKGAVDKGGQTMGKGE